MTDILVWMDLETTGLTDSAEIVEVACVVTDTDLRVLRSYESVVKPSFDGWDQIMSTPVVRDMHTQSRLMPLLESGRDLGEVSHRVVSLVRSVTETVDDPVCYLAGSGVASFDRKFIARDFPRLEAMLHYSAVDMGITGRTLRMVAGLDWEQPANTSPHRAMADVMAAIASARSLRETVRSLVLS